MLRTLAELRTNIGSTTRETQVNTLIDNFINLTLQEIHDFYPWNWLRRKQSFATVIDQEDYVLDEEVDRLGFIRQRTNPNKLLHVPDELFYKVVPDPEDRGSGNPLYYRLWEETGFSTNLAAADTIYVVSSSASDGASFNVVVVGRNSSGEIVSEIITLNGLTNVTSTNTWAVAGLMSVSKSAQTTGTISVYRTTGATLLSEIAPEETAPRFKRISLYPIPSAVITMYYEYYEQLRMLVNASDIPQMDSKWNWVLREGALAKMWTYKQNEEAATQAQLQFEKGLIMMRRTEMENLDYVPVLQPRIVRYSNVRRYGDSVSNNFPSYALVI